MLAAFWEKKKLQIADCFLEKEEVGGFFVVFVKKKKRLRLLAAL